MITQQKNKLGNVFIHVGALKWQWRGSYSYVVDSLSNAQRDVGGHQQALIYLQVKLLGVSISAAGRKEEIGSK